MTLQRKMMIVVVVLTVIGIVLSFAFAAQKSRVALAVLAAGCLSYFIVARVVHARHTAVLREAGARLGLDLLVAKGDEERSTWLSHMRRTADPDVFRWKIDGRLPALVGEYEGLPVTVRVPLGLDFDAAAPDSTRIAAYHKVKMTGFAIYDRTRLKKVPKGRQVALGDESFDSRFLVVALRVEEAQTVLSPAMRTLLLEAGDIGFRGIEVNRYGVFLHEEGKVSSPDLVGRRLALVVALARAAQELVQAEG